MGFWGTFLVAHSDRPLPDLDGVRDLADHIGWHGTGRDGWQEAAAVCGPRLRPLAAGARPGHPGAAGRPAGLPARPSHALYLRRCRDFGAAGRRGRTAASAAGVDAPGAVRAAG